jgi:hypothetical protein
MGYYEPFTGYMNESIFHFLEESIFEATGVPLVDLQRSNFGVEYNEYGAKQLKIIDLGL